jgi:flagellar basal-body rod protein FlgB
MRGTGTPLMGEVLGKNVTKSWRADKGLAATRNEALDFRRVADGVRFASTVSAMLDRLAGTLERYMDLLSARQKLVASNIANADTPGYRTRDIDFQSELQSAAGSAPNVVEVSGLPVKNDGNSVNLDREARLLAENALRFQLASSLLRSQIRIVRSAIEEGRTA